MILKTKKRFPVGTKKKNCLQSELWLIILVPSFNQMKLEQLGAAQLCLLLEPQQMNYKSINIEIRLRTKAVGFKEFVQTYHLQEHVQIG